MVQKVLDELNNKQTSENTVQKRFTYDFSGSVTLSWCNVIFVQPKDFFHMDYFKSLH